METKARPNDEQRDYNTSVTIDQTKIPHARKGLRMYGGNDKSLAEIAAEVKKTVVGQDEAVDWLCTFVDAACARSRIIHEQASTPFRFPASARR